MNINELSGSAYDLGDLNQLAKEIDIICRRKLRDGVMVGVLAGRESEIRQDAMIMLLCGFLLGNVRFMDAARRKDRDATAYHLAAAVSIALAYCKLRTARNLAGESAGHVQLSEFNGGSYRHHSDVATWELPDSIKRSMAMNGLKLAVKSGQLSTANLCIVSMVVEDEMSVAEISRKLKINPSAIYQQIARVIRVLPEWIEDMEIPMFQ